MATPNNTSTPSGSTASAPLPPTWQEKDAATVLRTFNPNMRPEDSIGPANVFAVAAKSNLKHQHVLDGMFQLEKRGYLDIPGGEQAKQITLTEAGYEALFSGHSAF